jgi:hypothetical protein
VTPQRPRKTLHPKPKPQKTRLKVAPKLTREEVRRLQAGAKVNLRSIAGYIAELVERDLRKRSGGGSRSVRGASPGDHRTSYDVGLTLTVEQRKRLEARGAQRGRSLSSYVAKVIVEALARR